MKEKEPEEKEAEKEEKANPPPAPPSITEEPATPEKVNSHP